MTIYFRGVGAALLVLLALAGVANAQNLSTRTSEDVSALFCDKLRDESLYDKYRFDSYKMLIPGNNGWIFRSQSDLRKDFSLTEEALNNLDELNKSFKRRGTDLVMLITPTRGMMDFEELPPAERKKFGFEDIDSIWKNYHKSLESIRNRGIHVVGIDRLKPGESFFHKRDHHWNPDGARAAAKALAAYIRTMPAYKDIEKTEFITKEESPYDFYGVSKKVFKKICGTSQPPEKIMRTHTERVDTSGKESDLFGEAKDPPIVLLGTSNSTMEPSFSNFEGFLKQELSADILNMSVSGGGLDTAMISYFNSPFFWNAPSKIAIWEIPGYYDISSEKNFFREAIPAAQGSCRDKAIASAEEILISDKTTIALQHLSGKKISGNRYYVAVNFNFPVSRDFFVDFRYMKNKDKYRFQRLNNYPHDGSFYVTLRDDKKEYLDKVILNMPAEFKGKKVSVSLCEKGKNDFVYASSHEEREQKPATGVYWLLEKVKYGMKL